MATISPKSGTGLGPTSNEDSGAQFGVEQSEKLSLSKLEARFPKIRLNACWEGKVEWEGDRAEMEVRNCARRTLKQEIKVRSYRRRDWRTLLDTLSSGKARVVIQAAGDRCRRPPLVNGGRRLQAADVHHARGEGGDRANVRIRAAAQSAELEGMEIVEKRFGAVPRSPFSTLAFIAHLPQAASIYPGPYEWVAQGIRRYGFHGINHQYCAGRAAQLLGKDLASLKLVTCHLGNGCSLAAIRDGRSVDTTMGFTPLEGLMMGTRSGSVDPGILTYLDAARAAQRRATRRNIE